jgi:hypothetical protein
VGEVTVSWHDTTQSGLPAISQIPILGSRRIGPSLVSRTKSADIYFPFVF